MKPVVKRLYGLILALGLAGILLQCSSCARRQAWPGFSHPAYLPARPLHTLDAERIRHLDSTAARNWAPYPGLFRP